MLEKVKESRGSFKGFCASDSKFAAAFLYKLDRRQNEFMKACRNEDERELVSSQFLNFDTVINAVTMGNFVPYLPSALKKSIRTSARLVKMMKPMVGEVAKAAEIVEKEEVLAKVITSVSRTRLYVKNASSRMMSGTRSRATRNS